MAGRRGSRCLNLNLAPGTVLFLTPAATCDLTASYHADATSSRVKPVSDLRYQRAVHKSRVGIAQHTHTVESAENDT